MASMGSRASSYGRGKAISFTNSSQGQMRTMIRSISGFTVEQVPWMPNSLLRESEIEWKRFPEEVYPSGFVKRKIMPITTAMQEELAYQKKKKKMDNSRKQSPDGSQESLVTVQGVSSSSSQQVVGIKRQAPMEDHLLYSHSGSLQSPQGIHICKDCDVVCAGDLNLQQHYQGKKHKARMQQLGLEKNGDVGNKPVRCHVCDITCMNEINYQQHLLGKKHATCLQALSKAKATVNLGLEEVTFEEFDGADSDKFREGMPIVWC